MGIPSSVLATILLLAAAAPAQAVQRPWLGATLKRSAAGELRIHALTEDSPAQRAGLRVGDRLVAVAGEIPRFVPGLLLDFAAGDALPLTIERDGLRERLEVELSDWPDGREPPPLPVYRKKEPGADSLQEI